MSRARDLADLGGSADAGGLTGRNLIINGQMTVAQRGTSSTNVSGIATVDRWHTQYVGGGITATQQSLSSSDTPYSFGFRNYLRMNNDTSYSSADGVRQIYQLIEAQYIANSGWNYTSASSYVTLSLWVRTSLAGKYRFELTSNDGTAQSFNFTETLAANAWTKITKTIPGNSNVTLDNDNGVGLTVNASLWLGTNYTDATTVLDAWSTFDATKSAPTDIANWGGTSSATFDVTGVQLEVGPTATDFEQEDYGTTLRKCQRYYETSGITLVTNIASTYPSGQWCVTKNHRPDFTITPAAGTGGAITALYNGVNVLDNAGRQSWFQANGHSADQLCVVIGDAEI